MENLPTECFDMVKELFGNNASSRPRVVEWYKRFSEGRDEVEKDERFCGYVTTRTAGKVQKIIKSVLKDQHMNIRIITDMENTIKDTVTEILHDKLNMMKVCAKMVPKTLMSKGTTG